MTYLDNVKLVVVALALTTGCLTEPHSCALGTDSPDPAIAQCAADDHATCVVRSHPECRGDVCVKWRANPGVCSVACVDQAGCGEHESCVEVVLGSQESHCVPSAYVD